MMQQPLLSITIPTWNRAACLAEGLEHLQNQMKDVKDGELEIFISDNGSSDNTREVVESYQKSGLPITYNRNEKNMGCDYNFLKCAQFAHGKYIVIMGDDDFFKPGALRKILDILQEEEIGLLHLTEFHPESECVRYDKIDDFVKEVSYNFTFMSANIFNASAIKGVESPEQYFNTGLLITPFFLDAAFSHSINKTYGMGNMLTCANAKGGNGGYNFFFVFVKCYLDMLKSFLVKYDLTRLYDWLRKEMYLKFHIVYVYKLLILKQNVKHVEGVHVTRDGFAIDDGWKILLHYYGDTCYFYFQTSKFVIKKLLSKIKSKFK